MLNLECTRAKTNLSGFRLRIFLEHTKYEFLKVFVNRTVPSDLFDCRRAGGRYTVFNNLEIKIKIFFGLAQFLFIKNSLKNIRKLCQD